tara:strand:- start:1952 stop:2332 length:381 start_codon:yes stop_codon:yes gene_type:complete
MKLILLTLIFSISTSQAVELQRRKTPSVKTNEAQWSKEGALIFPSGGAAEHYQDKDLTLKEVSEKNRRLKIKLKPAQHCITEDGQTIDHEHPLFSKCYQRQEKIRSQKSGKLIESESSVDILQITR